jgi:hypothetical protein
MREPFGAAKDQNTAVKLADEYGNQKLLADVQGIEKCSVVKRGHTTTITIVSDLSVVYEPGWEIRPSSRRARPARKPSLG